jgi:ubiquinone/menaquinone biosynthesis C-methylase UbiE
MIATLKRLIGHATYAAPIEKNAVDAYDLWAEHYDAQPGNLMLDLDELVFSDLLRGIDLQCKQVADIGCGTGRHWHKLLQNNPFNLTGFDVSRGMLNRLQAKFPEVYTYIITDNLFSYVPDAMYDVIVSTLTVAHIENLDEAMQAWCRILKKTADIIITDFHPNALAFGGKRTFEYHNAQIAVRNFVHYIADIKEVLLKHNFRVIKIDERIVDEQVKHYYADKNALHVYEKFKGARIIYGIHFRRGYNGVE